MKRKMEENHEFEMKPKLEDIYEPEHALEDCDFIKCEMKDEAKVRIPPSLLGHFQSSESI